MSTKTRAATAAAISIATGAAAGLTASYLGLAPAPSAQIGAAVSGAAGNLLYQALRLTRDDSDRASEGTGAVQADRSASDTETSTVTNAAENVKDTDMEGTTTGPAASATTPASGTSMDEGASPDRDGVADRKRPRHRKLARAAQWRIERRRRDARKENGHGAS